MSRLIEILLQGLFLGAEWGLVAVAFGLVVRITGIFHIALGGLYGLASYLCLWAIETRKLGDIFAVGLAALGTAALGVVIDRMIYQPITGGRRQQRVQVLAPFVASLGALVVLNNLAQLWYGSTPQGGNPPALGIVVIFGARAQVWDLVKVAISFVIVVGLTLWLTHTRSGRGTVALGQSSEGARVVGIDERAIRLKVFAVSGLLAGTSGAMVVLTQPVVPGQGLDIVIYAALVTLIFPKGAVLTWWITAIALGILYTVASVQAGSGWAEITSQASLISVLVIGRILVPRLRSGRWSRREPPTAAGSLAGSHNANECSA